MATPAATLSILIEANSSKAISQLGSMQKELERSGATVSRVEKQHAGFGRSVEASNKRASLSFKNVATSIAAAGGAFVAFEAAKKAIDTTVELTAATIKLSAATGLDAKTASTWIEAMKVRGVQANALSMGFITLERNIRNASSGSKTAVTAFKQLGVPIADIKKQNLQQTILEISDAFQKSHDPVQRAAIAQQLFGRNAKVLIPILAQGRKGVEDLLGTAQRYGAYLPNNIKQFKEAHEAQLNLNLAMDGMKIAFTQAVLPALVQVGQHFFTFIQQMRDGKGAGGQFASAVSTAFGIVKNVVTNVVTAVGGLGNALTIALAAFAVSKVAAFAGALKDMFAIIRANPVGVFFAAVGLLAAALTSLFPRQKSAAESAQQLANAWNNARDAARGLRDAELNITQTKLDLVRATVAERAAHQSADDAVKTYGRNSQQAKDADLNWQQAKVDLKRATNAHKDAIHDASTATRDNISKTVSAVQKTQDAISTDRHRISSLKDLITFMQDNGVKTDAVRGKQELLREAVKKLNADQRTLNSALHAMPAKMRTQVLVNTNFTSNVGSFISSLGGTIGNALGAAPKHFSGGLVTQPGYFAGEEAPRHPEFILATNPAYRSRNVGLWAQAGNALGMPGFATGGIAGAVSSSVPWDENKADSWAKSRGASWVKGKADKLRAQASNAAGAGGNAPGTVMATGGAPSQVAAAMSAAAAQIIGKPYLWGGGHGSFSSSGYDCSGAVSYILHAAGMLGSPLTTDGFANWGAPGPGKYVTIGDSTRRGHMMMSFFGRYLESGGGGPFGGGGVHWDPGWDGNFEIMRHPPGFARGGVYAAQGDGGEMPPKFLLARNPEAARSRRFLDYMRKVSGRPGFAKGGVFGRAAARIPRFAAGGVAFSGKVSTFGPPGEPAGGTAYGRSDADPGLSLRIPGTDFGDARNRALMGHMFLVRIGAHTGKLMDIDLGPAMWTNRNIDVTGAGARQMGINPLAFPTDAIGSVQQLVNGVPAGGGKVTVTTSGGGTISSKPPPHYPTGAVIAPPMRITQGLNLPWYQKFRRMQDLLAWSKTWQANLLGMPAPPTLRGMTPNTARGAGRVSSQIGAHKTALGRIGSQADTLEQYYNWGSLSLTDDNGNVITANVKKALSEIDIVLKLRQQVFNRWQMVVALTRRLVDANKAIVRRLQIGLRSIKTNGLKGAKLSAARQQIKNTKDQISRYSGFVSSAQDDLAGSSDSRDQAWLTLDTLRKTRATIAGTKPSPISTGDLGGGGTTPDTTSLDTGSSDSAGLLSTLLTQANQRYAVSEAQLGVFRNLPVMPLTGSFAAGGVTPLTGWAMVGERGPELAHLPGGTRVYSNQDTSSMAGQPVQVQVIVQDGAVDTSRIKVIANGEAQTVVRSQSRVGARNLPGRGGGRLSV